MTFINEAEFEKALVSILTTKGWEDKVLSYPTEKDLIENWANILFENNRSIDRLNNYPLTDGEMRQIIEQIIILKTPLRLNGFINGKTITIKRDNPKDKAHLGKEISLKIYDRHEIAAGQSRYQIAVQPRFSTKSKIMGKRRGDIMLLINGMPVIHIELKKSGIPVSQACHQIERYTHEGVFAGIFSLVQIFVAMNPEETVYFANPGSNGIFNKDYFFHWADFNNEPVNDWAEIASSLLSIPMAHQLIGFYTVADNSDGILKVLRSYQYQAVNAISDKIKLIKWGENSQLGGYIWHTTGSGKTMTSFKAAQLIANSNEADKVVFLTDRIELGTQSLKEYRSFADENESVQATEDTNVLTTKLKSPDPANILIVTSIQKMSRIKDEEGGLNSRDIEIINSKRLVFIVDEAHRSTFGDMLITIKNTFPYAVFFGFTGTPIHEENQKKMNTTATIFGDELHRYSIADGIRDKNVLGFDSYMIQTFKDTDLRRQVALKQANAKTEEEALKNPKKAAVYYKFMSPSQTKMAGYKNNKGKYVKGIEDYLPKSQYKTVAHQKMVIKDIKDNWAVLSHAGKFHALFATNSIPEAIAYYRLIKKEIPLLKITCLFDPHIDNTDGAIYKEDGLEEIIKDYNEKYEQDFTIATHAKFKKDIALRLAHKEQYKRIDKTPDKQINLLIVVDQMLTGFDSKWINTLYMDKMLEYENIIQAFSRTNRLFGPEKPFGTIRYYRKPYTMKQNIEKAVKLYSGDKPIGLFVQKLKYNLQMMNSIFEEISYIFVNAGIDNFEKLPESMEEKGKFASLFKEFNEYLEAGRIQGFNWHKSQYSFTDEQTDKIVNIKIEFTENIYLTLVQRYKELFDDSGEGAGINDDIPFDIDGYLTQIDTTVIDADYMNSRFKKYLKLLQQNDTSAKLLKQALNELHKSFARLSQEEQKYANLFLHDVERGDVIPENNKTLRDYITQYLYNAQNDAIHQFAQNLGVNEEKLRDLINKKPKDTNINEFGRFDELKATVDKTAAKEYFTKLEGKAPIPPMLNVKIDKILREFVLSKHF